METAQAPGPQKPAVQHRGDPASHLLDVPSVDHTHLLGHFLVSLIQEATGTEKHNLTGVQKHTHQQSWGHLGPSPNAPQRTTDWSRLQLHFGSLVRSCPNKKILHVNNTETDSSPDLRPLLFGNRKHYWTAWLVRVLRSSAAGRAWICIQNHRCHRDSEWHLQRWRSHRHTLHYVGCYSSRSKEMYPDWWPFLTSRRRFTRRCSESRVSSTLVWVFSSST